MVLGQLDVHRQKNELDPYLTIHKINSKWITDLNVKYKTIKLLEDNIRENLDKLGCGHNFSDTTPKAQSMKERIDKLYFIKVKNFCSVKDTVNRIRQATE